MKRAGKWDKEVRPTGVKAKLRELDVRPSKLRGQNFLFDKGYIQQIIDFGAPKSTETIVEIGPGLGALTETLQAFPNFKAIEIEEQFCTELAKKYPGITLINQDVRLVDFEELGENLVVFGNLPYRFSTDIIFHVLGFVGTVNRAVFLLQKEFAQRMAAGPGGKDYGVLSVSVQLAAAVRLGPIIPGEAFHPRTEVQSQVVALDFREHSAAPKDEHIWLKRVVSAGFMQRRKMLKNTLRAARIADGDKIDLAFEIANITPQRRAETLSIEEFASLARALAPYAHK